MAKNSKEFNKFKKDSEDYAEQQKNFQNENLELYKEVLNINEDLFGGLSEQEKNSKNFKDTSARV